MKTIHNFAIALVAVCLLIIVHAGMPIAIGGAFIVFVVRIVWQLIIAKLDPTDAMLTLALKNAKKLETSDLTPGQEHWLRLYVGGQSRLYYLYVPSTYDGQKRCRLLIAADGVTILCRRGNMAGINGFKAAAEQRGYFLAVLVPQATRYAGIVSGWNYPDGYLSYRRRRGDDVRYVNRLANELAAKLDPADILLAGFSAATDLCIEVVRNAKNPKLFKGIISICGTVLRRQSVPGGVGYLGINGIADTTLPWEGGAASLKIKALALLGNRSVSRSCPKEQLRQFIIANGYFAEHPRVRETRTFHRIEQFNPTLHTPVVQVFIGHPYGGHAMPSRATGAGADSKFKDHGDPIPSEHFELFDQIEAVFPPRF